MRNKQDAEDTKRTRVLLLAAHSGIAEASRYAVTRVGVSLRRKPAAIGATDLARGDPKVAAALARGIAEMTLTYPPERRPLTRAEEDALRQLKLTRAAKSALRKLIAEACASTMFNFFCVMDAVGDPGVAVKGKRWLGASFSVRREGPMLHDEFGELYWEYKRAIAKESAPTGARRRRV